LPHIMLKLVENTAALQANVLSGDVDMTPDGIGLTLDQAIPLEKDHSDRLRFIYKPHLNYEHLEVRLNNPILQDRNVREALLRGIDLKAIVDRLFGGHAGVALSFLNEIDQHYNDRCGPPIPTIPSAPAPSSMVLAGRRARMASVATRRVNG